MAVAKGWILWSLDNVGLVLKELTRLTPSYLLCDPGEKTHLDSTGCVCGGGSLVKTRFSAQLVKLVSFFVFGATVSDNDLCLIIHEMHIKVHTPAYANEDYRDHAKHT